MRHELVCAVLAATSLAACSQSVRDDGCDASTGALERTERTERTERAEAVVRAVDTRFGTSLLAQKAILNPAVVLPARAHEPLKLMVPGITLGITLEGALDQPGELANGVVLYPGAGPSESDLVHRVDGEGVEDYISFSKPLREVRYRLDVSEAPAAGLRLVGNTLEVLDGSGAPRLHMRAPWLLDGNGKHVEATVSVERCAVDRDPAPPWGRAVTAPGSASCVVRIGWPEIALPALLDPTWTNASGSMTTTRSWHIAALLSTGKVLLSGGSYKAGTATAYLASSELYDPMTKTFAATGAMTAGRSNHAWALLSDNKVLVTGGISPTGPLASAETYDPATGVWTATSPMVGARYRHAMVSLGSSGVLVAGGADATVPLQTAELYFPSTRTFSATGTMTWPRRDFTLATLTGGKVIAAFGYANKFPNIDLMQVEIFEPLTGAWSAGVDNSPARSNAASTVLPDGRVLIAGGYSVGSSANITNASVFNAATGAWSAGGSLSIRRQWHTLTTLSNGAALAAGGVTGDSNTPGTTFYATADLWTGTGFTSVTAMGTPRYAHTATALPDGTVLIAGGVNALGTLGSAEIFALAAIGETCSTNLMCKSGFCVDGSCCTSACTAPCQACSAALTGSTNGNCAAVLAGTDPKSSCKDDGSPTCMKNGMCDGAGACQNYPVATGCVAQACTTGSQCTSGYCYDGVCCNSFCSGTCKGCSAAKKGYSVDGLCENIKDGTDPDSECGTMGSGTCSSDGVCNGLGACRVTTTGTVCAPPSCVGTASAAAESACSATGTCTPKMTTSCAPYLCDPAGAKCRTTCAGDADCVPGLKCTAGVCAGKPIAATCTANTECTSGYCADGVCCSSSCTGQCEACDNAGSVGTCSAVLGKPHGIRTPCTGSMTDPICGQKCDGTNRSSCRYPSSTTTCGTNSCVGTNSVSERRCNSSGSCSSSGTRSCAPFLCDTATNACKTTCASQADCASGFNCVSGICQNAPSGTGCDGSQVINADGSRTDCFPYRCSGTRCSSTCISDANCAFGALCELQLRQCVVPNQDSSGCGCSVPVPSSTSERAALASFIAALLGCTVIRRRRSTSGRALPR